MHPKDTAKSMRRRGHFLPAVTRGIAMKILFLLLFTSLKGIAAGGQPISLTKKNAPLKEIFRSIQKQSQYAFFYGDDVLSAAKPVTIDVRDATIQRVLEICFRDQPLRYELDGNNIIVRKHATQALPELPVAGGALNLIDVRGKVLDEENRAIAKATITVRGTSNVVVTDGNGEFNLEAIDDKATLVISCVGYQPQVVAVSGASTMAIRMKVAVNNLEETLIVAYNTTTRKKNTGALTVVKMEDIATLPNRSFDRSLQGQVPGLLVASGTGQPGGGLSEFVIRGIGTGTSPTSGSTIRFPLVIIDGVPVSQDYVQPILQNFATPMSNPLSQINPNDIETITVLKDAAAIALYGSRASNGVVLVTTKKGKSGKSKLSFSNQTDISGRIKPRLEVLSRSEYMDLLYESYRNVPNGNYTDQRIKSDLISKFPYYLNSSGDTTLYTGPDWFEELFKSNAITSSNDLSISGATDKTSYYVNFSYLTQNGVLKKTGYDRYSTRFNLTSVATPYLTLGLNSTLSYNVQDFSGVAEESFETNGLAYGLSPLLPVRDINGEYILTYGYGNPYLSGQQIPNPVASTEYNINRTLSYRGMASGYAEVNFLKHFKLKSLLGVDYMFANTKQRIDPRITDNLQMALGGFISENDLTRTSYITTNTLRYDRNLPGGHSLNVVIGQEARVGVSKTVYATGEKFSSPFFTELSNAAERTSTSSYSKETLLSFFGQGNYGYKEKYLASLSVRRDGASKFGPRERFANFWSAGAGWVLTEERILKGKKWLPYLKLRGSVGTSGNSNSITSTTRFDLLKHVNYGGLTPVNVGLQTTSLGNPDIKWESTFNMDAGLEVKLLKDHLGFTIDVYKRKISNLLYSVPLPGLSGFGSIIDNYGEMENKGVEISLSTDVITTKDFSWNLRANWSINKNKLTKANPEIITTSTTINKVDENFGSFYLRKWAGVDETNGSPLWIDSTGKANPDYRAAKPELAGKPQPDGFGGITSTFRYKALELTLFFYYQYGFQIYDMAGSTLVNDGYGLPFINQSRAALDRWQKTGDKATNPIRVLNNPARANAPSTRYLYDGDYIKLSNAYLAYTVPATLVRKTGLSFIKVYVQGNNLALWSKFPGADPSNVKSDGGTSFAYPQQTSFSAGININF